MQRVHVEQLALDGLCVLLETGVRAEASTGGPPQLAADSLLLPDDMPDALDDELVVALVVRLRRGVGPALSGREDFELRLRYAAAFTVDVSKGIVPVHRAHEDEDAFGPLGNGRVLSRREHDIRQVGNGLLQSRVRARSVLPDLVSVGCQVNLTVGVAVQDVHTLVVEIDDGAVVLVLEESLVGADDLRVFPKPRPDSATQVDDTLNALGWQEGVTEYLLCFFARCGRRGPHAG